MLGTLQNEQRRTLAGQEAGSKAVERTDGPAGVGPWLDPSQDPHLPQGSQDQRLHGGISGSGEHGVANPLLDQPSGLKHGHDP
jgi:hypothetical protein